MRLTVLGCAGTFPGPDTPCSSYLVEAEGFRLLIDAGNGATGVLQRYPGLLGIDAALISHMHGDHYLDLITYTYARRYHPDGESPPLPIWGPEGMLRQIGNSFARPVGDLLAKVYDARELKAGPMDLGPFRLEFAPVNHPVETYAVRITHHERTITYSADSAPCSELVRLAKDSHLFLCEASYLEGDDNPPDVHMTGREAGEHATRADVGLLVLTHLVPWGDPVRTLQEAHEAFHGDIALASTRSIFEV